ncbi:MAG: hypothetical protein IJ191_00780 [Treponema sp.]|nr:hypothetical protein [Treponema sp.]
MGAQETQTAVLEDIVAEEYISALRESGQVEYIHEENNDTLKLLPKSSYADMLLNGRVKKVRDRLGYVTESLFWVKKEVLAENSTRVDTVPDTSLEAVTRVLRSASAMEGMQYYSNSRKEWSVLYKSVYMVKGANDWTRIPDENTGDANGQVSYCYQHDHTFGGCYYRLNYYQTGNEVAALFTNITWMKYGAIRAVKPEQLKISIVVTDCGEGYLFYIVSDADCVRFPLMTTRLTNSFRARIDALYKWFITQF